MARAPPRSFIVITALLLFVVFVVWAPQSASKSVQSVISPKTTLDTPSGEDVKVSHETLNGDVVMGKLGNETLKAELGRAAWKLFHTTMARFPDKPTSEESEALKSYIWLFARLYPCGECAQHFQQILKKYPPQTSSRTTAAGWACFVHNEVNKSKDKPLFDCSNIGDFYDCGCAEDEDENTEGTTNSKKDQKPTSLGDSPDEPVEISKEGPMRGG